MHDICELKNRVLRRVKVSGECWLWMGRKNHSGYGRLSVNGKDVKTHRIMYEWFWSPIPDDGVVCHACDIRNCVNPQHLWVGTRQQNQEDMRKKGRSAIGVRNPMAKLDPDKVKEIRSLKGTMLQREIATRFGVTQELVGKVHRGEIWRRV